MNWKVEAEEKLTRYPMMRRAIKNLPEEIRQLERAARSLPGQGLRLTPVKGMGGAREDVLLGNLIRRQELQWSLEQALDWVARTEQGLRALTAEERLVLQVLYMEDVPGAVERLCQQLQAERKTIYRRRDKALRKFTLALYGALES